MATIESAVACLISFGVMNEPLTTGRLCGIILIFTSVVLLNYQLPQKTILSNDFDINYIGNFSDKLNNHLYKY